MFDDCYVTNGGAKLLEKWSGGGTLTVDRASAGTGTVPKESLISSEALVSEKQDMSIITQFVTENGMEFHLQFAPSEAPYTANQIGLWLHIDSEEPVLFAIYQDDVGIQIPSSAEMPEFVYAFYAVISVNNTGKMDVNVDPNAYLTMKSLVEVETRLKEITATAETKMREILERAAMPVYNVTIPTDGWNLGEDGKQHITVEAEDVRATDTPVADVDLSTGSLAENLAILKAFALIMEIDTGDGNVKFSAAAAPDVEIPINIKEVR